MRQPPEVSVSHGAHAHAGLLRDSLRNSVDAGARTASDVGDAAPDLTVKTPRRHHVRRSGITVGGAAGGSRLWELYLTAISAGGSRPEQAGRPVQGQGRFLRRLHSRGAPHGRVADAIERPRQRALPQPARMRPSAPSGGRLRAQAGHQLSRVVDGFDNRVETAYTGWPDRLYLIAQGGRILTRANRDPSDFIRTTWHRPSKHRSRLTEHRSVQSREKFGRLRESCQKGSATGTRGAFPSGRWSRKTSENSVCPTPPRHRPLPILTKISGETRMHSSFTTCRVSLSHPPTRAPKLRSVFCTSSIVMHFC